MKRKQTTPCQQCDSPATARYLCDMHYRRARRAGTLADHRKMTRRNHPVLRPLSENLPPTPQPTPCRITQSALSSKGYGQRADGEYLHRWVVRMVGHDQYGTAWDDGLEVCHQCDNRPCFRYDHLWLDTHHNNMLDAAAKGRMR